MLQKMVREESDGGEVQFMLTPPSPKQSALTLVPISKDRSESGETNEFKDLVVRTELFKNK